MKESITFALILLWITTFSPAKTNPTPRLRADFSFKELELDQEVKRTTPNATIDLEVSTSATERAHSMKTEWIIPIKLLSVLGINLAVTFFGVLVYRCVREWQKVNNVYNRGFPRPPPIALLPAQFHIHINPIEMIQIGPNNANNPTSITRLGRKG